MKAFILAAGSGSRLGDKTKLLPKPMIKVHGKPVLEQNIVMCKEAGVRVCHTKNIPILSRIWKAHR